MAITPLEALSLDETDLRAIETIEEVLDRHLRSSFKKTQDGVVQFSLDLAGGEFRYGVNRLVMAELIAIYGEKGWTVQSQSSSGTSITIRETRGGSAMRDFLSERERQRKSPKVVKEITETAQQTIQDGQRAMEL